MKTVSLRDFIYSQYLKYIAHICRAENTAITMKMLFTKPSKKYCREPWTKIADLHVGSVNRPKEVGTLRTAGLVWQRFNQSP